MGVVRLHKFNCILRVYVYTGNQMLLLVQMSTSVQSLSGPACSRVKVCVDIILLYAPHYYGNLAC